MDSSGAYCNEKSSRPFFALDAVQEFGRVIDKSAQIMGIVRLEKISALGQLERQMAGLANGHFVVLGAQDQQFQALTAIGSYL
jgi:hypothetical protein